MVGCGQKSNSFKLLWVSLLTARMRKIYSKMKVLEWSQQISNCKSMQILYDARGKLTPQSCFWFYFKFKLIQAFIIVLTCKNEEDPIKNEGARAVTTMLHYLSFFFRCSKTANSLIDDGILRKFRFIRAFIVVLLQV